MFFLIYKITNLVNGKIYIGAHRTKDLNDGYMGSGTQITRAIKKYGLQNFKKDILFIFNSEEEMFAKEAEIVNKDFVLREDTYNITCGGYGSDMKKATRTFLQKLKDPIYYKNYCRKQQQKYIDHPDCKQKISNKLKQYYKTHKGSFFGKSHSEQTKQKMKDLHKIHEFQCGSKNSQYGKHWIINPITGEKKSLFPKDIQKYLEDGWIYGRSLKRPKMSLTDKTIDKMDLSEQEKQKLKQQNKEIRRQYKQKRKEELGKCYLFTNNKTGEKKIIPEKDIQQLDNNWYSPFYILDNNKKYIEQQLLHGKTIQDLTTEFNIGYDNFYSWYRKYAKDIKQKLDQQKIKKFTSICPVCGNSFINKNRRMFCSKQCWKQSMKNKCWVRKEKDLKHVNKEDLNNYLNSGWVQIIPIFNKCSDEWKVL